MKRFSNTTQYLWADGSIREEVEINMTKLQEWREEAEESFNQSDFSTQVIRILILIDLLDQYDKGWDKRGLVFADAFMNMHDTRLMEKVIKEYRTIKKPTLGDTIISPPDDSPEAIKPTPKEGDQSNEWLPKKFRSRE